MAVQVGEKNQTTSEPQVKSIVLSPALPTEHVGGIWSFPISWVLQGWRARNLGEKDAKVPFTSGCQG